MAQNDEEAAAAQNYGPFQPPPPAVCELWAGPGGHSSWEFGRASLLVDGPGRPRRLLRHQRGARAQRCLLRPLRRRLFSFSFLRRERILRSPLLLLLLVRRRRRRRRLALLRVRRRCRRHSAD